MTRRNFNGIANIVRQTFLDCSSQKERAIVELMAYKMVNMFKGENPRFNSSLFYERCGIGVNTYFHDLPASIVALVENVIVNYGERNTRFTGERIYISESRFSCVYGLDMDIFVSIFDRMVDRGSLIEDGSNSNGSMVYRLADRVTDDEHAPEDY